MILLIESDAILASNVKKIFKRAGYDVAWQPDPQTAIDSADKAKPDIVVADLLLANRSGVEFLYEFRSYPDWQKVPIIIYSDVAAAEFDAAGTGFNQLGIAGYHHKPSSSLTELVKSVDAMLRPSKA